MKKLSLFAMITLTVFILSSCEKEAVQPMQPKATESAQIKSFNEKNSIMLTWNQLPENLKNAEMYESNVDAGTANRVTASYLTSIGPWGGGGGKSYAIYPLSSTDKIYAMAIRSGSFVDGLSVWYIRTNGSIYAYTVGGTGGTFYLQPFTANERITAIAGRSGTYLDRLTIYTNVKNFSYGGNGGSAFYAGASGNQVLGFYGGAATYVDRIGAYIYSL
jgi:hypothetical protein